MSFTKPSISRCQQSTSNLQRRRQNRTEQPQSLFQSITCKQSGNTDTCIYPLAQPVYYTWSFQMLASFLPPDENLMILRVQLPAQLEIRLTHMKSLSHQRSCAPPDCPLPSFLIMQRTVRPGDHPANFPSPGTPPKK